MIEASMRTWERMKARGNDIDAHSARRIAVGTDASPMAMASSLWS
jgi:hypothetical protein